MLANAAHFPGGTPTPEVFLKARGWSGNARSGGLKSAAVAVTIPVGAYLIRLFMEDPGRGDFGQWWITPYEYDRICRYFAVSGDVLARGRAKGDSAFHGGLGLLREWYSGSKTQLGRFHLAKTLQPVAAMYGEGDVAISTKGAVPLKPFLLEDGKTPRQLFLPEAWTYKSAFAILTGSDGGETDADLPRRIASIPWTRLPFE